MSTAGRNRTLVAGLVLLLLGIGAWLLLRTSAAGEPRVEFVGLQDWTRDMIADSLAYYAPGTPLHSAGCAVVLRDSIGFAQAAVHRFTSSFRRDVVILTLIEPQDSARVRFAPPYADSLPPREEWAEAVAVASANFGAFQFFQDRDFAQGEMDRSLGRDVPNDVVRLRDLVLSYATEADFNAAVQTLETDRNRDNRIVAALVLGNFPGRDGTWHAYVRTLQHSPEHATSAANMMLASLTEKAARQIDWAPIEPTLRALLDGTNLFAYDDVLAALTATNIDPALARELLRGGGELPLAIISADRHPHAPIVRRFLIHAAGEDHGSADRWAEWVVRL